MTCRKNVQPKAPKMKYNVGHILQDWIPHVFNPYLDKDGNDQRQVNNCLSLNMVLATRGLIGVSTLHQPRRHFDHRNRNHVPSA